MQRRGPDLSLRDRIERVRGRAGGRPVAPAAGRRRRVSRREREARRQRQLRWGMGIAGAAIVLILAVGLTNEYVLKPRYVLANVGGTEIRRRDYWKKRSVDLIQQANQYRQFAGFVEADQQQQYLQLASQSESELRDVWGSTTVDETSLNGMIDDQVYLQNLDQLNLEVSDQEVDEYILQQFDPENAPLATPMPTPTLIPERAAAQTQTAEAEQATLAAEEPSPTPATPAGVAPVPTRAALPPPPGSGPGAGSAPIESTLVLPLDEATPMAVPGSPEAVPTVGTPIAGSPIASPAAGTPEPAPTIVPTPNPEQARATAAAGYEQFQDNVFEVAHLSEDDYERLVARPAVARDKVRAAIEEQVGQSAEQVHAAHVLVETRDLAQSIYEQVTQQGVDFAQAAREQSTDEGTAVNGGDLGWFAAEEMVPPFATAAFALQPGQVSEPVQTEFGWHVIKVVEREANRPLSDEQIPKLQQTRVDRWLEERRADSRIRSDLQPTETPAAQTFEPPVDAPPTPTPPPLPESSPVGDLGSLPVDSAASPVP